ncbi:PspC domain-containing protein [Gracilibacillus sp. S3-1-1]|uniref:PspC domain-containing protein n=1 Tax=Gracilibacillus pellucidus TaxID=3095368 RepID=A0ACC6M5V8_9BACI|nr:PspC domain-containing protein [Gracilibacillus sp. S3-1-1]MDX8046339.1 PspC domain-containing protein [Gracilibacillus sp. S3-1-1]
MKIRIRRSTTNQSLDGVCGGIAEHFGISPFLVRLAFIFLIPAGLFVYIILANVMDAPVQSL